MNCPFPADDDDRNRSPRRPEFDAEPTESAADDSWDEYGAWPPDELDLGLDDEPEPGPDDFWIELDDEDF